MQIHKNLLLSILLPITVNASWTNWKVTGQVSSVKMPKARSDMSTTLVDDRIYIIGGCDSKQGNEPVDPDDLSRGFFCNSITDANVAYSPMNDKFIDLEPAPRKRFRHAAVAVNGRIWLIGGLNAGYNLVNEVDVYDTATGKWTTPGVLQNVTSDLAAFAFENRIYYVGGYEWESIDRSNPSDAIYSFKSIDALVESEDETYVIPVKNYTKTLGTPRGDVHAASWGPWVYIAGGFTSTDENDDFKCSPLNTVEVFDLQSDAHGFVRPMITSRGDKGLAVMNGILFAIGGERKENCDTERLNVVEVVNEAEAFDATSPLSASWKSIGEVYNNRFRYTLVAYPKLNTMYTFGGQHFYDEKCSCYKTSDDVVHYKYSVEKTLVDDKDELSFELIFGLTFGILGFIGLVAFGILIRRKRSYEKSVPVIFTGTDKPELELQSDDDSGII